ncbi:MAG: bifunctional metallophosphatase/5'-nucleotidase, partial [Rhodospirillaceae bacterium]
CLFAVLGFGSVMAVTAPAWAQSNEPASSEPGNNETSSSEMGTPPPAVTLRILHINDVNEISADRSGFGGFASLKTLIDQHSQGVDEVLVTFGGDLISPSLLSSINQGEHMIAFMNAIGTDLAVPGNHEYDFGAAVFEQRRAESDFAWLGTNIRAVDGSEIPTLTQTTMISVGPYQIGAFGLVTPDTEELSRPDSGHFFQEPIDVAETVVPALRADGADVVIALTHLATAQDLVLAREVEGIDLVLGGHEHTPTTIYTHDTLVHKSGSSARYLGVIDLTIATVGETPEDWAVEVTPSWQMVVNRGVVKDPEIKALKAKYKAVLDKELAEEIGRTEVVLDSRHDTVRLRESNFANLMADAIKAETAADIAIINGGGIRGNSFLEAGSPLTRQDILAELPFGDVVVLLQAPGAAILAALENGFSQIEDSAGRFPQVSEGVEVVYDPTQSPGLRVVSVTIRGEAIDPAKTYRLATNDYLAKGGDGYRTFADLPQLIDATSARLMATIVMDHIKAAETVAPEVEGRLVVR